jgi:predicted  nucleic acid-binding Zn-ribbon protein
VSEDRTKDLPTTHSFEEKVLIHLEAIEGRLTGIESRLDGVESRLQNLESKQYDTKPIWERALSEIAETRQEINERFETLDASITVLSGDVTRLRGSSFTIKRPPEKPEPEKKRA